MGLLIIDSKKENLERYKKLFKNGDNHFVSGLNDSLMLLETVYEFDLAICNYKLDDATGKDLHENFRMLPETENVHIIFILDENNENIENKIKKMSLTSLLISPTDEQLNNEVHRILNNKSSSFVSTEEEFPEETTAVNNQIDFDSLMDEISSDITKEDNNNLTQNSTNDIENLSLKSDFIGDIKTTPISKILTVILENNYNVQIELNNEISEENCIITIKNKNIVNIKMEDFDIEDALFWVLNWDIAKIKVKIIEDIYETKCEIPIEEIIEEVINKRNEFDELSETLPDLDTILVQTPTYDSALTDLEEEYKKIIELFDGNNTINDVISLINDDNIYILTIISQLYMDEILILPEESKINKEEFTLNENIIENKEINDNNEDEDLLSNYLTEDEDKEEDLDLDINTEVLETDDNFEELNKEQYINKLIESFKEEEEVIIRPKESPFKIALLVLFIINISLTTLIFTYNPKPQKIIINNLNKEEKIIKKINLYNLGLENKIHYIKNKIDVVNDVLKQKLLKEKRNISYDKIFKDNNLNSILKKADFYMLKGNYKKAISLYKKIIKYTPNKNQILLKLATAYYNNEDNNNAMKIIEKLNFLKENSNNFIFLKAQVYQATNNLKEAYKYYNKFLEKSNDKLLNKDIRVIMKNIYRNTKIVRGQP